MRAVIDETDWAIIGLLRENGRLPNTEIAKGLKISEAAVRKRLKRLIDEEIIRVLGEDLGRRLGTQRIYSYPSRIAAETDGRYFYLLNIARLNDYLTRRVEEKRIYSEKPRWDTPRPFGLLFVLFVSLMTVEWILRKRWQLL